MYTGHSLSSPAIFEPMHTSFWPSAARTADDQTTELTSILRSVLRDSEEASVAISLLGLCGHSVLAQVDQSGVWHAYLNTAPLRLRPANEMTGTIAALIAWGWEAPYAHAEDCDTCHGIISGEYCGWACPIGSFAESDACSAFARRTWLTSEVTMARELLCALAIVTGESGPLAVFYDAVCWSHGGDEFHVPDLNAARFGPDWLSDITHGAGIEIEPW